MLYTVVIIIIFLFICIIFYGINRFNSLVQKEKESMFNLFEKKEIRTFSRDLERFPPTMISYLNKVGVIGKCRSCNVTFKQTGRIKTKQDKNWINFTATQYMTGKVPNFIWSARAYPMFIRDKCMLGKGEVKVSLFGLKEVAKSDGSKTNESALSRCLGELLFYPVGFLSNAISWEALNNGSLKATVIVGDTKAQGIFFFNEDGLLHRFKSKRYMGETLEDFTGIAKDYRMVNGLYIPTKMSAIWNLQEGDFEYFDCIISDYHIE